ncbi:MAG: hypothetical protein ACM3U2_16920 [Deltaproteobacteria bacterium]
MPIPAMRFNPSIVTGCRLGAIGGFLLAALTGPPAQGQPRGSSGNHERPVVQVEIPGIDKAYAEAKFIFDLVGDKKGYDTFKETIDVFLTGVETTKPCDICLFATPDGLQAVGSLPMASDAEFKKFLRNLWDLDVKSAPPPESALMPQVPPAVRSRLSSLKLQPSERLIFGLTDGFARYESGRIYLAETHDAVRRENAHPRAEAAGNATVTLSIDGDAVAPDRRHAAFAKSRERAVSGLKKNEHDSDAGFALQKALLDFQLARLEVLFCESSLGEIAWSTSHEKKRSDISATFAPQNGTSLAKDVQQFGQAPDEFAGVSREKAVLISSINMPVNAGLGKSFKSVVRQGREYVKFRIEHASNLDAGQKASDRDVADLIFDVMEDVAAMPVFNGFLRTWSNGDGTLTTVGATRVDDGHKFEEAVRKLRGREALGRKGGQPGVEVHRVTVHQWREAYRELFDKDGAVFVGTSPDAIWYAAGENALERLEQSIHEAEGKSQATPGAAMELHAEMRPLAEVWSRIHSRRPKGVAQQVADRSNGKAKPAVAQAASIVADLDLPKIAAEAYRGGHDTIGVSLKRQGDKAVFSARFDEGTLRFVGQALSRFVKDNLED